MVLRGVGFRGGSYVDSTPVLPLTGAPATEIRGVHTQFLTPQFFPMRMWTPNHFPALGGTIGTNLLVTPVQHRAADAVLGTTTRRVYTNLNLRLYYSGDLSQAALSDAPAIVSVDGQYDGTGVSFAVRVVGDPAAAMQEVWITYTDGGGNWTPLESRPVRERRVSADATIPSCGRGAFPSRRCRRTSSTSCRRRTASVSSRTTTSWVAYYSGGHAGGDDARVERAAEHRGVFGDIPAVNATLLASGTPVAGKIVTIGIGATAQVGVTDANGNVNVNVPVQTLPGSYQLTAAFGGDEAFLPASTSAPFTVGQATTSLVWDCDTALFTTLTASLGGTPRRCCRRQSSTSCLQPGAVRRPSS